MKEKLFSHLPTRTSHAHISTLPTPHLSNTICTVAHTHLYCTNKCTHTLTLQTQTVAQFNTHAHDPTHILSLARAHTNCLPLTHTLDYSPSSPHTFSPTHFSPHTHTNRTAGL